MLRGIVLTLFLIETDRRRKGLEQNERLGREQVWQYLNSYILWKDDKEVHGL